MAAVATPAPESAAGRRSLASQGRALPDGTFPVPDAAYWDKARQAIGRVKDPAKRAQVARLLRKTAPQVGRTQALQDSWAGGSDQANPDGGIYLAADTATCPACGHKGTPGEFGISGTDLQAQPSVLQAPAPNTGFVRDGIPGNPTGSAAHALANDTRRAVELAAGVTRHPIHGPWDVLASRNADGSSLLRHRQGGATIATLRKTPEGKWVASVNGRDGQPRDIQRTALMEAVGQWNGAVRAAQQGQPLIPPAVQTPLMERYGIPAMRSAAFATPVTGASDGPRTTTADAGSGGGGSTDGNGLTPRGQGIYKKLIARGFPPARALAFAKNAQKTRAGSFGKAG